MPLRETTPEEADDHWTEHGNLTPAEVWTREQEAREPRPCKCGSPSCPQAPDA